jgi:sodium/bile acid cotransporter 7
MKIDSFVIALLIVVGLAYFLPEPAHFLPLDTIASVGISLVFFFYGLKLSPSKIKSGLSNWRLHIVIQASTFLVFPLLLLLIKPLFNGQDEELMWLGLFFLAALPSTVSSSVVMVSIAKGNIPAAIFNATISGLIGIFITPLWMGLFVSSGKIELTEVYLKLLSEILLPITIGFVLQKRLGKLTEKYSLFFTQFDRCVILLVIYKSFVHSFESQVFSSVKWIDFMQLCIWVVALFIVMYGGIFVICGKLNFSREDKIAAAFCGTKKSLMHGTVFSKVIFGNFIGIGIILLPLMLFHAFQLLIIGLLASRYNERSLTEQ